MDQALVASWANELQRSLHSHAVKLSRKAARQEACMLLMVAKGIRCAGLVATFATTNQTAVALQHFLQNVNIARTVFVLVHLHSQQLFVVHRALFRQRLAKHRQERESIQAFYPISVNAAQAEIQSDMPLYLHNVLLSLSDDIEKAQQHVDILHIDATPGALRGIALAGWLLEYALVYFYVVAKDDQQVLTRYREAKDLCTLSPRSEAGANIAINTNNLAGTPLIVFCVQLCTGNTESPSSCEEIMQFSMPSGETQNIAHLFALHGNESVTAIARHVENMFKDRLHNGAYVKVTWHEQTMDRVAM